MFLPRRCTDRPGDQIQFSGAWYFRVLCTKLASWWLPDLWKKLCCPVLRSCLRRPLFFLDDINPDDGSSKIFLKATTILPDYTVSHSKRRQSLSESNPGGGEIFRTRPDWLWGPPSILYNWYRVFPGCKAAGAWRWPPTPSRPEVKERVQLYLYSPSGPSWPVLGWTLPLPLPLPVFKHIWPV